MDTCYERQVLMMTKYSVITYNDGDNRTTRIAEIIKILSDYSPDLFGLQETQQINKKVRVVSTITYYLE